MIDERLAPVKGRSRRTLYELKTPISSQFDVD